MKGFLIFVVSLFLCWLIFWQLTPLGPVFFADFPTWADTKDNLVGLIRISIPAALICGGPIVLVLVGYGIYKLAKLLTENALDCIPKKKKKKKKENTQFDRLKF